MLSDCGHCWDNPRTCGADYKNWSVKQLKDQIAMLQKVLDKKLSETTAEETHEG